MPASPMSSSPASIASGIRLRTRHLQVLAVDQHRGQQRLEARHAGGVERPSTHPRHGDITVLHVGDRSRLVLGIASAPVASELDVDQPARPATDLVREAHRVRSRHPGDGHLQRDRFGVALAARLVAERVRLLHAVNATARQVT